MRRLISLLLVVVMLAGCAGMTDRQRTRAEGAAFGGATGAATGAIIGKLSSKNKNKDSTCKYALIGGLIGGTLGFCYGNNVANIKESYVKIENYLNARIASARQVNQRTSEYNVTLKRDISQINAKVEHLKKLSGKNKASLSNQGKVINAKLNEAGKKRESLRKEIEAYKNDIVNTKNKSLSQVAKLNREIENLEKNLSELDNRIKSLAGAGHKCTT